MKNLILMILFLALIAGGCSKDYTWDNPLDPVNDIGPNIFNESPINGSQNIDTSNVYTYCSWAVSDPNLGDSIRGCEIYFGTITIPPYLGKAQPYGDYSIQMFYYDLKDLKPATTYYWKVVAYDNHRKSSTSPIWSFRTAP